MKAKVIIQFDIEIPDSIMEMPKGDQEPEALRYMFKSGLDVHDGIVLEISERTPGDE